MGPSPSWLCGEPILESGTHPVCVDILPDGIQTSRLRRASWRANPLHHGHRFFPDTARSLNGVGKRGCEQFPTSWGTCSRLAKP